MSNRDRIDRMQEEADVTQREREAAAKERQRAGGTPARKSTADPGRLKLVWAVKDGGGEIVATYPYSRKDAATAEAARLEQTEQRTYIVCPHKVPFDD